MGKSEGLTLTRPENHGVGKGDSRKMVRFKHHHLQGKDTQGWWRELKTLKWRKGFSREGFFAGEERRGLKGFREGGSLKEGIHRAFIKQRGERGEDDNFKERELRRTCLPKPRGRAARKGLCRKKMLASCRNWKVPSLTVLSNPSEKCEKGGDDFGRASRLFLLPGYAFSFCGQGGWEEGGAPLENQGARCASQKRGPLS